MSIGDIKADPEVALVVAECQSRHMPTEFMDTMIECVNGRVDRQVSWSEFFTALCTETPAIETSMAFHIRRCLDEQNDYIQEKLTEMREASDKANECIATRLNSVGEATDADRRKRRSPFAEAFKLKKRSADAAIIGLGVN